VDIYTHKLRLLQIIIGAPQGHRTHELQRVGGKRAETLKR
jgi:hypothetical protein